MTGLILAVALAVPHRGVVEGFYGTAWTPEDRVTLIGQMGEWGLNTYVYGPKDDPYHNAKWSEPYPDGMVPQLKSYLAAAEKAKVEFYWALHLGSAFTTNAAQHAEAYAKVFRKLEHMHGIGVRAFGLFFDDFGRADAELHSEICNRVKREFLDRKGDCANLVMCPNVYWSGGGDRYCKTIGERLDPSISIMWTGPGCCVEIHTNVTENVAKTYRRAPFVWWNWPVNDYCGHLIVMGRMYGIDEYPYGGFVMNPMPQCEASKIAIRQMATWMRDPKGFDSHKAHAAAIEELFPACAEPLKVFASHNADTSMLRRDESDGFEPSAAAFAKLRSVADELKANLPAKYPKLWKDISPWVESFADEAELGCRLYAGDNDTNLLARIESRRQKAATRVILPFLRDFSRRMTPTLATPIAPIGENGQAAWNGRARWFIYAPTFGFTNVNKAASYRFTVTDDKGAVRTFTAKKATAALSPVWNELPTGYVEVKAEGLGKKGEVVSFAGSRRFWKTAPFDAAKCPTAKRPYREAAKAICDYIVSQPHMRHLEETGEIDMSYALNGYPSKMFSAQIAALLKCGKAELAKMLADRLIARAEPAGAPLEFFTLTYDGGGHEDVSKKYADLIMLKYPAVAGLALLDVAQATGGTKYREHALKIADTYLKLQGEDGTWFLKLNRKTGKAANPNRLVPTEDVVPFLELVFKMTGATKYREAAERAIAFVENGSVRTWNWDAQFEDVEPKAPYRNLTEHGAASYAIYLAERHPGDRAKMALARELVRFCEDQFVCWSEPYAGHDLPEGEDRTHWATCFQDWVYPCSLEQYGYYVPIDASAAKMIRAYLALYRVERNPEDLAKARALGNAMTLAQSANGRLRTWWRKPVDRKDNGDDWDNCMVASAEALEELADQTFVAREVTVRKGLGNFYTKCVPGATVRVAFFGGSITEADGWKTFTMENLRRRFPETKFELIDAALGGTGSDYGVYRLAKDVLPYKPDLMFVEFLVNDGDSNRLRAIEGYVRNYYAAFPESDIVFTYTLSKQTAPTFQRGLLPKGAEAFERVAERYGIPSITMGLKAAEMANRGELVWNKGDTQVKALAGKETEKDRPEDASGPIVFLSDGAHPYRETGHRLYAEAVARGLDAIAVAKLPPVDRRILPEPLESAMGTVRFYSPEAAQEAGLALKGAGWRNDTTIQTSWWKTRPSFYKFYKSSWRSGPGEASITFRFKGAGVLFAPLYGPGTGAAEITVDGRSRRVDFFDMYSAFWRMGPYLLCDKLDPNAVHEVTIRNLPGVCDREKVMREAGRGADYEKHKADFQAPQELMFCGLYVEGEIEK